MAAVEHWVFDLDNTLYSAQCRIFHQIDRRMGEFIAGLLGLAYEDARRLQKKYFHTYGTTLRGLMNNHQVDPSAYLEFVHDIDLTAVAPDLALDAALARLPGIKVIFTNASRGHAEQVIRALGVARHFAAIFDIQDAGYLPKPEPETYDRFIARHRITRIANPPFAANEDFIVRTDDHCNFDSPGQTRVYDRRAGTITELDDRLWVSFTSDGLIASGTFGAKALIDPETFEYTFVLPALAPGSEGQSSGPDVSWSPDDVYVSRGFAGGHGGLCG